MTDPMPRLNLCILHLTHKRGDIPVSGRPPVPFVTNQHGAFASVTHGWYTGDSMRGRRKFRSLRMGAKVDDRR
jgi:hypothetical protein